MNMFGHYYVLDISQQKKHTNTTAEINMKVFEVENNFP